MFVCPEIEKVNLTPRQLFYLYVLETRYDTNKRMIEGIDADGDNGNWELLKKGLNAQRNLNQIWYAKRESLKTLSGFRMPSNAKTIAEFATHTSIAISTNFTDTNKFYWGISDIFEAKSGFWFTVFTPDGLFFAKPKATGQDRGLILPKDIMISQEFSKVLNYEGETTGDIKISIPPTIIPKVVNASYKEMAVRKEIARQNYIVFNAPAVYSVCDYVRSYNGLRYVILSGRKVAKNLYQYTAVLEVKENFSFSGADVQFSQIYDSLNAQYVRGWQGIERHFRITSPNNTLNYAFTPNIEIQVKNNMVNGLTLIEHYDTYDAFTPSSGTWVVPKTGVYLLFLKARIIHQPVSSFSANSFVRFQVKKGSSWYRRIVHYNLSRFKTIDTAIQLNLTTNDNVTFWFRTGDGANPRFWNLDRWDNFTEGHHFDIEVWRIF